MAQAHARSQASDQHEPGGRHDPGRDGAARLLAAGSLPGRGAKLFAAALADEDPVPAPLDAHRVWLLARPRSTPRVARLISLDCSLMVHSIATGTHEVGDG